MNKPQAEGKLKQTFKLCCRSGSDEVKYTMKTQMLCLSKVIFTYSYGWIESSKVSSKDIGY